MISFNNATILSYNQDNLFFGDEILRYKLVKKLSIKGYIDDLTNDFGVSGVISGIEDIIKNSHDFDDIIINSYNFGKGKIVGLSFNEGVWVRSTEYNVNLEIYDTGNYYNLTGENYSGLKGIFESPLMNLELLDSLNENFAFTVDPENVYSYNHSVSIKYLSGDNTNPINRAKLLASGLLLNAVPFGFINSQFSGFYNSPGKRYYSESYNLIDYSCSFLEKFELTKETGIYSAKHTHQIQTNNEGVTTVTENGEVKGIVEDIYLASLSGLNIEISNSFPRCLDVFQAYTNNSFYQISGVPLAVQRSINKYDGVSTYSISYSNDPKLHTGYSWEYTLSHNRNADNIYSIQEEGAIFGLGVDDKYNKAAIGYTGISGSIPDRIFNYYTGVKNNFRSIFLINKSRNDSFYQGNIAYNWQYSDDPSLKSGILKRIELNVSDNGPVHKFRVFPIVNNKEVVQYQNQTEISSRAISLDIQMDSKNFDLNSCLSGSVEIAKNLANEITGVDVYPLTPSYNFDEQEGVFKFGVTYNHIQVKDYKELK